MIHKFTAGPWEFERHERDGFNGEHYTYPDDKLSALLGPFDPNGPMDWIEVGGPNQVANAKLIASAPDLLAALDEMLKQYSDDSGGFGSPKYNAIHQAALAMQKAGAL